MAVGDRRETAISEIGSLWGFRGLIWQMAVRDVVGRYRGSALGLMWSLVNPIFMLIIYTFVFGVVLKVKWSGNTESQPEFALVLFVGLIIYNMLAETITRASTLIVSNANYVKKVVFPVEILSIMVVGSALFHALIGIGVLLVASAVIRLAVPYTAIFVPVILVPFVLLILGIAWFLSSVGVYLRDVAQTAGILCSMLLFLGPVFYPRTALPDGLAGLAVLNPLTVIVEQSRNVLIWGNSPDWGALGGYFLVSTLAAVSGLVWFRKTKKGFADVI